MKFLINSHEDEEITWKWTLIRSTLIRVLTANIYLILADGSLWLGFKSSPFSADLEDFLKDTLNGVFVVGQIFKLLTAYTPIRV